MSHLGIHMQSRAQAIKLFVNEEIPSYRIKQLYEAVFSQGIIDYDQISVLPKSLREKLKTKFPILSIDVTKIQKSSDKKTIKVLFQLKSKDQIEAVLMRFRDGRNTVCISCQAGCAMGCHFCATDKLKLTHNLSSEEIIDQVLFFLSYVKSENENISNIVFMGMGEPFANYGNVMEAINVFTSAEYFNFSARRITISTCGIIPGIDKLAEETLPVNLAISLHAPNQKLREQIMPIAKTYPLELLIASLHNYFNKTHRRISLEYILLNNINDRPEHALELANVANDKIFHVNLIPYNSTGFDNMRGSDQKTVLAFKNILQNNGVNATVRVTMGQDISAACGQLANKTN